MAVVVFLSSPLLSQVQPDPTKTRIILLAVVVFLSSPSLSQVQPDPTKTKIILLVVVIFLSFPSLSQVQPDPTKTRIILLAVVIFLSSPSPIWFFLTSYKFRKSCYLFLPPQLQEKLPHELSTPTYPQKKC